VTLAGGINLSVRQGKPLEEDTLTVVNPTDMWLLHTKRDEVDGEEVETPIEIV